MKLQIVTADAMQNLGAALFNTLPQQAIVYLQGDLGAGKTTLVRGFLRAAGFQGAVKSPTYNLVEEYQINTRLFCHFDLYRLTDPEELEWMGIRDYFSQQLVSFIEWPEMGQGFLPKPDLEIKLDIQGDTRMAHLTGHGELDLNL